MNDIASMDDAAAKVRGRYADARIVEPPEPEKAGAVGVFCDEAGWLSMVSGEDRVQRAWIAAAAKIAASPPADLFPALVAHLRAWVAEHADKFDRAFLTVESGEVCLVAIRRSAQPDPGLSSLMADLDDAIYHDDRFSPTFVQGRYFATQHASPGFPAHVQGMIVELDDPSAPAIIADRIRTAEELRAELAKVTKERDESSTLDHAVSVIRRAFAGMAEDERCVFVQERIMDGYCDLCGSGVLPCYCCSAYDE